MLYSYKKRQVSKKTKPKNSYFIRNVNKNKKFNFILILTIYFIWLVGFSLYIHPYILSYNKNYEANKYIVNASTVLKNLSIPNSESSYTQNASKSIQDITKEISLVPKLHPELQHITGEMKLSIPKLDANNIPVQINVDSTDEKIYMPILNHKLAHFKGTSLPGNLGNVFIYGHSINEFWTHFNSKHPSVVFTNLDKLDIGDEIKLIYQNQTFTYKVSKARIVSPQDLSSIYSRNTNTLTLMTCWPPGIGTERLIVIATEKKEI